MRPTVAYLYHRFDYFNKLCFEGKLKTPPIGVNNRVSSAGLTHFRVTRNLLGQKSYTDFRIEISVRLDLPAEEFDYTLVHEMIHYHILCNNLKDDSPHGHLFRTIMRELNRKHNLKIALKFNPEEELLMKPTSVTRIVCVLELKDGKTGMAVVARTKVFDIWDVFARNENVENMRWYASNMAIFQHYRTFQTPKYYLLEADQVQHFLTDAVELERNGNVIARKK